MMGFKHDVLVEMYPIDLERIGMVTSLVNTLDKPCLENIIKTVCIYLSQGRWRHCSKDYSSYFVNRLAFCVSTVLNSRPFVDTGKSC